MGQKRPQPVSQQLQRLIRESELSAYAIAKASGVHKSALSRFLSGERALSLRAIDRIGRVLNLRLTSERPKRKDG